MKTLYLPINSQNFNNIFASESISPCSFYKKRGFGIPRFKTLFSEINDYLVLFNQPPEISLENSDEVAYILIFQLSVDESCLKQISEGIWIYPRTIYLSLKNFKKLYFLSDYEKKFVVAGAESSKTTKGIRKYESIFEILDKKSQKKYDFNFNNKIEENKTIQYEIERDRVFNSFKGFLYGILCGYMKTKSEDETEYSKSLRQVTNDFAMLKNRMANSDKASVKKQIIRLEESVCQSELLFKRTFGYEGSDLISRFFESQFLAMWQWVQLLEEKSDSKSLFENNVIKSLQKNSDTPIFAEFQIIKQSIDRYISNENKSYKDGLDSDIKRAIFNLEKYGESKFSKKTATNLPDLNNFDFEVATKKIKLKTSDLNKEDKNHYETLLSILMKHAKNQRGKVHDDFFIDIVKDFASIAYPTKTPKLLKYLQHEEYDFDIQKDTRGTVFQNLAAFIFKPNCLEELQEYLEDKKIDNHWIAYSFWGVFNGFASMGKNFTVNIFDNRNHSLINSIDEYLSRLIETVRNCEPSVYTSEKKTEKIQSQFDEKISESGNEDLKSDDNLISSQIDFEQIKRIISEGMSKENSTKTKNALLKIKNQVLDCVTLIEREIQNETTLYPADNCQYLLQNRLKDKLFEIKGVGAKRIQTILSYLEKSKLCS